MTFLLGHVLDRLRQLPDRRIHMCVTSPPYFGLRDYGTPPQVWGGEWPCVYGWCAGQQEFCPRCNAWRGSLGLEPTPELYIQHLVEIFREVKRVLRDDGTCWIVIGDSYAGSGKGSSASEVQRGNRGSDMQRFTRPGSGRADGIVDERAQRNRDGIGQVQGYKQKDLIGIPWMLAFALRDEGWYWRSTIIWQKTAPMPESVDDRPTASWEAVLLLSKSANYFYDGEAVKEGAKQPDRVRADKVGGISHMERQQHGEGGMFNGSTKRNMRNVWTIGPEPLAEEHFATYPTEIPKRAILAGTSERGVCTKCGAGWERIVKRENTKPGVTGGAAPYEADRPDGMTLRAGGFGDGSSKTIGWRPTCSHNDEAVPVPATVLDPFIGSGSTALAAERLGRRWIGIDLSQKYERIIERRILGMELRHRPEALEGSIFELMQGLESNA